MAPPSHLGLSIGALSSAVSIPVATLRTWERRYGYPVADRRPSGHRRYPLAVVDELRLVKQLLEQGHRPSEVLPTSLEELGRLLALEPESEEPATHRERPDFEAWFEAVRRADGGALERHLRMGTAEHGTVGFFDGQLSPFLVEVGHRWATGDLTVAEEHFASHVVRDFLVSQWRPIRAHPQSPIVVCVTLPGEHHVVGLHMAATVLALGSWDVRFLGGDTPVASVAGAARAVAAQAVCIGASPAASAVRLARRVTELSELLDGSVALWLGGCAVSSKVAELVVTVGSMADLDRICRAV